MKYGYSIPNSNVRTMFLTVYIKEFREPFFIHIAFIRRRRLSPPLTSRFDRGHNQNLPEVNHLNQNSFLSGLALKTPFVPSHPIKINRRYIHSVPDGMNQFACKVVHSNIMLQLSVLELTGLSSCWLEIWIQEGSR